MEYNIKRASKSDVFQDLRDKILKEDLPQGFSLIERELSETYGISRTPMREILWNLMADGVVEQRPSQGFFVRKLDWKQIFEIYQTREAVEGMAARLASQRQSETLMEQLRNLIEELEAINVAHDSSEGVRIGRQMHKIIIDAASNRFLYEFYEKLSNLAVLTSNLAVKSIDIENKSKGHHLKIMRSIVNGEEQESENSMREHLQITCRNLVHMLYPSIFPRDGT